MTQKTILGSFSKFVFLNIFGMLGLSCYILADTFFVANGLGTNGVASLNLAIAIYSFIQATGLMIGVGGATKYAILKAQDDVKAHGIFTQSMILGVFFGAIFLLIGLLGSRQLSVALGANAETFQMTHTYLKTILCFAPCFIMNNILIAFVRNDNAPKLAMSGMLIGSGSNIVLDYIFIFPLGWGMFGAAFATGLAPLISMALLSLHFRKKENGLNLFMIKINPKIMQNLLGIGISSFITEVSSGIVLMIFNMVILRIAGNIGVAAYGIVANLSLVAMSMFVGIAQGMQPLVSSSFGQNNQTQLKALLKYAVVLCLIIFTALYAGISLFSEQIISAFNSEANPILAEYARSGLSIYFTGFFFAGINIVVVSFLSSSQNPRNAFLISVVRGFAAIIPLVLVLPHFFGITGVWLVFPFGELISFLMVLCMVLHLQNTCAFSEM